MSKVEMDALGRWRFGDLAQDENGNLLEVIGFVRDPMVVFRPVGSKNRQSHRYEVAGCPNELKGLTRFEKKEAGS